MATIENIAAEVRGLIVHLVDAALVREYYWPRTRRRGRQSTISFANDEYVAEAMKLDTYVEIYEYLARKRAYNVMMLDGAIVQLMYRFDRRGLTSHRLAFLPVPALHQFHDASDYPHGDQIANVSDSREMPVPVRIDYDDAEGSHHPVTHPKCHLTLGQRRSCRIPVSSPLTPCRFMDFLLRSFYDDEDRAYANQLPRSKRGFASSIHAEEREVVHIAVPAGPRSS